MIPREESAPRVRGFTINSAATARNSRSTTTGTKLKSRLACFAMSKWSTWWRCCRVKTDKETQVLVAGHYDSLNIVTKKPIPPEGLPPGERIEYDDEKTVAALAPGVTDDGSGTAAVMELARIMSHYEFDKTIVFVAFAGEEYGEIGSIPLCGEGGKRKAEN